MNTAGVKWSVRCLKCKWRGVRTDGQCECYEDWGVYCRPGTPGPGCPRGVVWPCPRCKGTVVAVGSVLSRARAEATA